MPTRPIEPRGTAGGVQTPLLMLALAWAGIALIWLSWLSGRIVAAVAGATGGPAFGAAYVEDLVKGDWAALWPGASPTVVAVVYGVLVTLIAGLATVAVALWQARRADPHDPLPSLASDHDMRPMTLPQVAEKARRLRPSLAAVDAKDIEAPSAGVLLGGHCRRGRACPHLYASWEDVLVAIMAPRAGKTTALAAPAVLAAPGAVIATSNKRDLWTVTAAARAEHGDVLAFDPQGILHLPQTWWVDLLALVHTIEDAQRLADHFVQQIRSGGKGDDFWSLGALDLLASLILAAALKTGGTLTDVQRWLSDPTDREPAALLTQHSFGATARALAGRQAGAPETRDGIYETARTAAACLANPEIMRWVTPSPLRALRTFDVAAFPTSADTLYLLSKDGAGGAAPLVAALTDQVLRAAVIAAERAGGRLDAPMVAVLDEAANVCKISDLPELYSHFGSRGIMVLTILQSYRQGTRVWGEPGMDALWSAATVKLIGAGIDDARFAEDLSRLAGEHDVDVASRTRDGQGHTSYQTSVRRQRVLEPAQIRAMPKGRALLMATGVKMAMVELLPWYRGPRAAELAAADAAAVRLITERARQRTVSATAG